MAKVIIIGNANTGQAIKTMLDKKHDVEIICVSQTNEIKSSITDQFSKEPLEITAVKHHDYFKPPKTRRDRRKTRV